MMATTTFDGSFRQSSPSLIVFARVLFMDLFATFYLVLIAKRNELRISKIW